MWATNWLTADATFRESAGAVASPAKTAAAYRLYALAGQKVPKPGLLRVDDGEGSGIDVEVWRLSPQAFGRFVAAIPAPLGIGTIELEDGTAPKGFLVEP